MADEKNDATQFVLKLQDMMNSYKEIVDWNQNYTEIVVKDLKKATDEVLPKYFRHRKFQSFVRQLNMYNFYKVCRQKNNTISFKNDIFYKGNQDNFCKIKRKKRTDYKSKPSETLQENISFITNYSGLDPTTKNILSNILDFKNVAVHCNKKLELTIERLVPEMKATKFKKYESIIDQLKQSAQNLNTKSNEIDQILSNIKNLNVIEVPVPDCDKQIPINYGYFQRNFDMSLSQNNICSTLYEHCQQKRFQSRSNIPNNNFNIKINTFMSVTHFFDDNNKAPSMAKLEEYEGPIVSRLSKMSIQDQIQNH